MKYNFKCFLKMNENQPNGKVFYQHDKTERRENTPSCLQKISSLVANTLESLFYRLGCLVGAYPVPTILICLAIAGIFAGGLKFFHQETKPGNLWVPSNSLAQQHLKWIDENYPADYLRFQFIIVEAENVLDPKVVKAMLTIDKKIKSITLSGGYNWENLCARLGSSCWSRSILELWSFNDTVISALNTSDIVDTINSTVISPVYFSPFDADKFLGGIIRDSSGKIISAKAVFMQYVLKSNDSLENEDKPGNVVARDWEDKFMEITKSGSPEVTKVYYEAQRSNSDVGTGAIFGDIKLLFVGFVIIFVFVAISLGKFNCVHQRIFLSISGILCIGFSVGVSIGLSSYAGVFFGPLHNILPFLILGVGVDDMFVIVQAWEVSKEDTAELPMSERIGLTLKRAGVSITITSLTDVVAFGIGATTVIPALCSFCIYATIGILGLYFFASTFFVACVTLDNQRASMYRNACVCCYVHKDYKPNRCSRKELLQTFFDKFYSPYLTKWQVKLVAVLIAMGLLAPGIYGVIHLEQDFDPNWFIPDDTYLKDYIAANNKYFPLDGKPGYIYIGEIDYPGKLTRLVQLHQDIENLDKIYSGTVESWYYHFYQWLQTSDSSTVLSKINQTGSVHLPSSDADFYQLLLLFLYGDPTNGIRPLGSRYIRDIVFNETDTNSTLPRHIKISKVAYQHSSLDSASEEIKAMEDIRKLIVDTGIQPMYPFSRFYLIWEGNKVIQIELFRNIALAFLCVFVMTLILIAHPLTCIMVSISVIATLVDVGGFIYWWGLTIDIVTSINLILAVGLAVDYAAHIGHMFMTVKGTRNERTRSTLSKMGPAVFNGGFSTFLAFILLAGSTSYVFRVFFRVFFGVVVFGLYHGLVLLPVLLSLIGPARYLTSDEMKDTYEDTEKKKRKYIAENISLDPNEPVMGTAVNNGSLQGTDNDGFDPPTEMYARVNKSQKKKKSETLQKQDENLVWQWKDYPQEQQQQQQQHSHTLPIRGNWNQQQQNNMYPQWNTQWTPYTGYFTIGGNPTQRAYSGHNANDVGWRTAPRGKKAKRESTSATPATQNVLGYPYTNSPQQSQQVYNPPAYHTMFPTDRFYQQNRL